MLKRALLASAGLLALVLPEVFQDFFDGLRKSPHLWVYQYACVAWIGVVVLASVPWGELAVWRKKRFRGEARIRTDIQPGTARMGVFGMLQKPTADMLLTNDGGPFTLIAHARLTDVSGGYQWAQSDKWEYEPRRVRGGGTSFFHMATVQQADNNPNEWVVVVRAEQMMHVRRWQGRGPLWFDLEWSFYSDVDSTLHLIKTVGVRVLLADDRRSFVMNFKP